MENQLDTRLFETFEIRAADGDKPLQLLGYAAVFNKLSLDLGGFREQVMPGAFKRTLQDVADGKQVVNSFFNHDRNWLLASTANGTLRLKEDEKGLYAEMEPMMTTMNEHCIALIRAKGIRNMSFTFSTYPKGKDQWEYQKGKDAIRTLLDVDLYDVAPVVEPAYPQTSIKVRDYLKALQESGKPDNQGLSPTGMADGSLELYRQKINIAEL